MTTTLAILAGGAGSRMGRPKAELRVGDRPILCWLLDRLRWDGPTLLVTAPGRERPPGAERFTREVTDPTGGEGPLRGVLTALEAVETETAVVATCDMPRVGPRQLEWLATALAHRPAAPALLLSRAGNLEPFPLALRRSALPSLSALFASGERAVHSLQDLERAVVLPAPHDWSNDVWINLNTPADLAALEEGGDL